MELGNPRSWVYKLLSVLAALHLHFQWRFNNILRNIPRESPEVVKCPAITDIWSYAKWLNNLLNKVYGQRAVNALYKLIYFLSFRDDAEVLKLAEWNGSSVYFCHARVTEILSAPPFVSKFLCFMLYFVLIYSPCNLVAYICLVRLFFPAICLWKVLYCMLSSINQWINQQIYEGLLWKFVWI